VVLKHVLYSILNMEVMLTKQLVQNHIKIQNPGIELMMAIADGMDTSLDELTGRIVRPKIKQPPFPEESSKCYWSPLVAWNHLHERRYTDDMLDGKYPLLGYPEHLWKHIVVSTVENDLLDIAHPNDRIVIHLGEEFIEDGDCIVARINDSNVLKKVVVYPNMRIIYGSEKYLPQMIPKEHVRIIGKVIGIYHKTM